MQPTLQNGSLPLKLWERIKIIVGEESAEGYYIARVEDFTDDSIIISSPELVSGNTLLRNESECEVQITSDDAIYKFSTRIRMHVSGNQRLYQLDFPGDIKRIQRRQFVRIKLWQKVTYAFVKSANDNKHVCPDSLRWHQTQSINVSGGGILIRTNKELAIDDLVIVRSSFFDEIGLPEAIAGICRRSFKEGKEFISGVEFILNDQVDSYFDCACRKRLPAAVTNYDLLMQNRLVIHIFRQQLELRRKGLL